MSSLKIQKASLHTGHPSDTVGCISGALFVLWALCHCLMRKKTHTQWASGKHITCGRHHLPIWHNFSKLSFIMTFYGLNDSFTISKTHLPMPRHTRARLDWWYYTDPPNPCLLLCSLLLSRPDKPRSSVLIGCWNVEKALLVPRRSCLHYNLFVFQFSVRYWKVEKEISHLARRPPQETGPTQVQHQAQIFSEALVRETEWIELQVHGFEVKCKAA